MAGANQAYHNRFATGHGLGAATMTLARYYARQQEKAQLKAAGLKPQYMNRREINLVADRLLAEHWSIYMAKAKASLAEIKRFAQEAKH